MKKFRVWSNKQNRYYGFDIPLHSFGTWDETDRFEEFTGLIDMNGREVYEGDKVRIYLDTEYRGKSQVYDGVVRFHHGTYHVYVDGKITATLSIFWDKNNKIDVIAIG